MSNTKSIFSNLRHAISYLNSDSEVKNEPFRKETLSSLRSFVYSGCYTKYRNKTMFLEIEDLKDDEIAKRLKISVAGVRQARKRISEDAYDLLGYDVTDNILYGDEKICESIQASISILVYVCTNDNFLFSDVVSRFEDSYIGDGTEKFSLSSCRNEMLFLRLYTLKPFSELVSILDSERLNYLIRVLNGDVDSGERLLVLKYLHNEDNDLSLLCDYFKSHFSGATKGKKTKPKEEKEE